MSNNATQSLINDLQGDKLIGGATADVVETLDLGAEIQQRIGIPDDLVTSTGEVLLEVVVDDSGSIRFASNTQVMRDAVNALKPTLLKAHDREDVFANIALLNGPLYVFDPRTGKREPALKFVPIQDLPLLDDHNYNPMGGTPLRDRIIDTCIVTMQQAKKQADQGIKARIINLITTDGHDEGSRATIAQCRTVVTDFLKSETRILAAIGIDDAPLECPQCRFDLRTTDLKVTACPNCGEQFARTDFKQVFAELGFKPEWILTPRNTEKEIRAALQLFSSRAQTASQNAGSFSKVAGGGFTV